MEKSENLGMQTFDAALFKLYQAGRISLDETITNADSPNNLRLRIKLASGEGSAEGSELNKTETNKSSFGELSLEAIKEDKPDDEPSPFRPM
jgi:twitching motility protein PilU